MKKIFFTLSLMFSLCISAQNVDYGFYSKQVKSEIKTKKKEIKDINKQIKANKNDVQLHKLLVIKTTELDALNQKNEKIKYAIKLYNKLAKENEKFDKWKVQLLNLKEESRKADLEITK